MPNNARPASLWTDTAGSASGMEAWSFTHDGTGEITLVQGRPEMRAAFVLESDVGGVKTWRMTVDPTGAGPEMVVANLAGTVHVFS